MRQITEKFFESSTIEKNEDTIATMDFIACPESVCKMINATNAHYPALSGIVAELEEKFGDCEGFPLNHNAADKNAKNRRNVGWMVRFVMREFGYSPLEYSDRTRIGSNSGSKYFGNASLYEKTTDESAYLLCNSSLITSKDWNSSNVKLKKNDTDYLTIKNNMKTIKARIKKLPINIDSLTSYLRRTGFNNCISDVDVMCFVNGQFVPCIELYEAMDRALTLFEMFAAFGVKKK